MNLYQELQAGHSGAAARQPRLVLSDPGQASDAAAAAASQILCPNANLIEQTHTRGAKKPRTGPASGCLAGRR